MKKIILIALAVCTATIINVNAQTPWFITGNAGTNATTNFIGTTDNVAFKIRTKNLVRITVNGAGKVGIGITSPVFKLDVKGGSINTDSVYRIGGNTVLSVKGNGNTFAGRNSGFSNTTGYWNTANGSSAFYSNTTGNFNTANGVNALFNNNSGHSNTANGVNALFNNNSGHSNTANGYNALISNTTGTYNTATGRDALYSNTTGFNNTANGYGALIYNSTGTYNTASGMDALRNNNLGYSNTASGYQALYANTTGYDNTANGYGALKNNTTGSYNSASGYQSLYWNTIGLLNTAFGYQSLYYNASGSYNTALGYISGANAGYNLSNSTALGYNAGHVDNASNEIEIGNTSVGWIAGQVGWSNWSDKRIKDNIQSNVPGLSFITRLNPVTYNLNIHRQNEMCGINDTNEWEGKYDIEKITQTGFLAQEVEQAAKESNYDFNGVRAPKGNVKLYSVQYAAFVVPLVKAVQELNEELKSEVRSLKSEIEMIKSVLSLEQKQKFDEIRNENKGNLEQNSPNPFNTQTEIKCLLPEIFLTAQLIITDANGKQVRNDVLKSSSTVIIKAAELSAGTYSYSLVIDGINIDSKQMILTK